MMLGLQKIRIKYWRGFMKQEKASKITSGLPQNMSWKWLAIQIIMHYVYI
jgi:hypothetical protein